MKKDMDKDPIIEPDFIDDLSVGPEEDISLTLPDDDPNTEPDPEEISLTLGEDADPEDIPGPEPEPISLSLPEEEPENTSEEPADEDVVPETEPISLTLPEEEPEKTADENDEPDFEPESISLTLPEEEPENASDDSPNEETAPEAEPASDDPADEDTAPEAEPAPDFPADENAAPAPASAEKSGTPEEPSDENVPEYDESSGAGKPRRRIAPMIILPLVILVILAAIASVCLWYLSQRSQVKESLEDYLGYVKEMDFDRMESMIQSNDFSALENADITNEVFHDFFRTLNQDMTYTVNRIKLDISNNTARGVGHIRYVDGTEIYKETISEFLKKMVSNSFGGKDLTEQETQQKLADMLIEKAASADLVYAEADILYPMVKVDGVWKVVSLDDETVRIMSANFKNVQDEIDRTINGETASAEEGPMAYVPENGQSLDLTTDQFSIRYNKHVLARDFAGEPCLLLYYDYTNNSTDVSSAMVDVQISAYQHGKKCAAAIPESLDSALDQYIKEVKPGETVLVCQAFELADDTDVTVQAEEAFRLSNDTVHTLVLKFS